MNGYSAGTRPTALSETNKDRAEIVYGSNELHSEYESWIVKFANSQDGIDAGAIEYAYTLMAMAR